MSEWQHMRITGLVHLAKGGGGEIHRAARRGPDGVEREAIVKLAKPGDAESERSIVGEARLLSSLNHPNIIQIYDYGRYKKDGEWVPFLLLEHGGVSVTRIRTELGGSKLRRGEPPRIEPGLACFIALEVCAGLEHAHARGIIHRDIKPGNVLVGTCGQVKLIDFGIAKGKARLEETTKNALLKGTVSYVSPEQLRGTSRVDRRADLWAVGVLLYEMLTGEPPWTADQDEPELVWRTAIARKILDTPAPPLPAWVPIELATVVMRLLEKDRNHRYSTATETMRALIAAGTVSSWVAKAELSRISSAAHDRSTRVRNPRHNATTTPLNASDRRPLKRVELEIPDGVEISEDLLFTSEFTADELETVREEGESTDVLPELPEQRRTAPRALAFVAVLAAVAIGLFVWRGPTAAGTPPPVKPAKPAATASKPLAPAHSLATKPKASPKPASKPPLTLTPSSAPSLQPQAEVVPVKRPAATRTRKAHKKKDEQPPASLSVIVVPRGAHVQLDRRSPTVAPATFEGLRPGNHRLKVGLKPGDWTKRQTVRLGPGANEIRIELIANNPFAEDP